MSARCLRVGINPTPTSQNGCDSENFPLSQPLPHGCGRGVRFVTDRLLNIGYWLLFNGYCLCCNSGKVAIEREQRHACMGYAERERVRRSQMQQRNATTENGIEDGARTCLSKASPAAQFEMTEQREQSHACMSYAES